MEFALGKGLYDDAEHCAQDQVLTDLHLLHMIPFGWLVGLLSGFWFAQFFCLMNS